MPSARLHSYSPKHSQLWVLGLILFVSGFCSLVYQVVWLREFRLIFGGATPAASAVLAVFMAGLGIGGAVLGRFVEKARSPGRFYAIIELGIAVTAALTPFVLALVRHLYIKTGGIQSMGLTAATLVQIGMTALVLGLPCFMMGGTLPAALKFGQTDADERRAITAAFYGVNVAGAVSGAFIATFFMLGIGGNFLTLMTAAFLNLLIGLLAFVMLRPAVKTTTSATTAEIETPCENEPLDALAEPARGTPPGFIYLAAFASGFVFFLIELVWFRMSIPLFGGSVFNFGIILAMALAGIGAGSLLYSLALRRLRPSLLGFSVVSSLFAFAIIVPFALGDNLAHACVLLNNFYQARSFWDSVLGWSMISVVMVFPAAFFAGIQFPLLISLLGRGNPGIGAQLGKTYGWNTAGAVLGSLLGGFQMIPALSLPGCWRFCAAFAVLVALLALFLAMARRGTTGNPISTWKALAPTLLATVTLVLVFGSQGPSGYWQHNPIGYGRAHGVYREGKARVQDEMRRRNRIIVRAYDGREASVALAGTPEYAILTNGKSDSSALMDAPTTVMLGLTGAALHAGNLDRVGVVGMGTGVTVGWLAQVENVGHIDVMELEKSTWDLSKFFRAVNFDAPNHSKVGLLQGDARELLLTRGPAYNLIVSEPSNIHRAGVANLYTREFYQSAAARMTPDAIFCQWVQAYETQPGSLHLVVSTLRSVFPKVELWQTSDSDLLLVCSMTPEPWDGKALQGQLRKEPFATAVRRFWGTDSIEGFLSHCLANQVHAENMAKALAVFNTDSMNMLELSFGQSLGTKSSSMLTEIWNQANASRACLPALTGIRLDMAQWAREQLWRQYMFHEPILLPSPPDGSHQWDSGLTAEQTHLRGLKTNSGLPVEAAMAGTVAARMIRAHRLATAGDPAFPEAVKTIEKDWPIEAVLFSGLHAFSTKDYPKSAQLILEGIRMTQENPWLRNSVLVEAEARLTLLIQDHQAALIDDYPAFFEILSKPAASGTLGDSRSLMLTNLARHLPLKYKLRAVDAWGKFFPWNDRLLLFRLDAWREARHPDLSLAEKEFRDYLKQNGLLEDDLRK